MRTLQLHEIEHISGGWTQVGVTIFLGTVMPFIAGAQSGFLQTDLIESTLLTSVLCTGSSSLITRALPSSFDMLRENLGLASAMSIVGYGLGYAAQAAWNSYGK